MPKDITNFDKSMDLENSLYFEFVFFENLINQHKYCVIQMLSYYISSLCSPNLKKSHLNALQDLEEKLVQEIYEIFPSTLRSTNFHQLLHLPKFAREYGSLINVSSYNVESLMGTISNQVQTGTKIAEQIFNKMKIVTTMDAMIGPTIFDESTLNFKKNGYIKEKKEQTYTIQAQNNNKLCQDCFAKLNNGSYMLILHKRESDDGTINRGFKFSASPYVMNFKNKSYTMCHVRHGTLDPTKVLSFTHYEIEAPFVFYEQDSNKGILFDIFNRHR